MTEQQKDQKISDCQNDKNDCKEDVVMESEPSEHSTKADTGLNQSCSVTESVQSSLSKDQPELNQEIETTKDSEKQDKEFKGLQNQGATCYMNSLLQSLYMTLEFRQMIYKWSYDPKINPDKKDCIIYQLQKLFATLEFGQQPYAMTHDLTSSFQWDTSQSFEQQDVQEFMRVLFDAIEQSFEINNIFGVVEDLYMGEGSDFLKCHSCGYESINKTKFYDLQLPIKNEYEQTPPNGSIEQALFNYLKPEILQGDNAYQCSGCGQKVTASKGSRLERLPKILTLQLQRFTLDMVTWQRKKLNDRVTFPLVLNMNHFLNEQKQSDWASTEMLIKQNPLNEVRPALFKAECVQQAQKEAMQRVSGNKVQARYDEAMARELGEFDETNLAPQAVGTLAQQRRAEQLKLQQEHKAKLRALKLKTKTKAKKKVGGFDRAQINSSFFNNAKSNKDAVQGWAFDFDNPDAGQAVKEDQAIIDQVMKDSLKDSAKSAEAKQSDEIESMPPQVKSADQATKQDDNSNLHTIEQISIKADLDDQTKVEKLSKEELLSKIETANVELKEKYLQEGNFVYELYALMVHNGGAYGGHYYAYIKDIESGKWYNFNDSSVRPISVFEVVEMFGPEPPSKRPNMAAKRMAATRNANAYMMMYRLIDPTEDLQQLKVHEDEIPPEVLEDVKSSEHKQHEYKSVQEKKSQTMQLKVIYYPPKHIQSALEDQLETRVFYVDRREDTYESFFEKVYTDFIGQDNQDKDKSNFRIRAYNVQYKIMLDTYTGREQETLEVLKIYPMKTLALEEKLTQEAFTEYDPNQMVIKVNVWQQGITSLSEEVLKPQQIKVQKETLMGDFLDLLSKQFNIVLTNVTVLKRNPMLNTKCMELLSDQPDKKLNQLRVNEGVNLFVEDGSIEMPESLNQFNSDDFEVDPQTQVKPTKWEKEFELESNRFQVKFNDPHTLNLSDTDLKTAINAQQISDTQKQIYTKFLIVDRRISVLDLKIKICETFDLQLSGLVFRRGGSHGTELLEDELSLKQAQFYNMICLYLEKGIPSQVGQKRVKMFLAQYSGSMGQEEKEESKVEQNMENGLVALPDHCFFQFQELLEIPVKTAQKITIVKTQVIKKIDEVFPELGLMKVDQSRIRFREKSGEDKLTQVFHGNRDLNRYQIYDGKEIAIQITPHLQDLTETEQEESHLIMIKLWNQSDWTLSDPIELYITKIATLDQFAQILSKQFPHIATKDFKCTKINSSWNFSRVQLPYEQWVGLDQSLDFFTAAPFYVSTDGILFIVKDDSLTGREMTAEEREMYRSDDFEVNMFSQGSGKPGQRNYQKSKEQGVKIKVAAKQQDQEMYHQDPKEVGVEISVVKVKDDKDVEMK